MRCTHNDNFSLWMGWQVRVVDNPFLHVFSLAAPLGHWLFSILITVVTNLSPFRSLGLSPTGSVHTQLAHRCWKNGWHLQTTFSNVVFKWNLLNLIYSSLRCVPDGPSNSTSALLEVMAWRRRGNNLVPKPMMTQFADVYMRHWGSLSL